MHNFSSLKSLSMPGSLPRIYPGRTDEKKKTRKRKSKKKRTKKKLMRLWGQKIEQIWMHYWETFASKCVVFWSGFVFASNILEGTCGYNWVLNGRLFVRWIRNDATQLLAGVVIEICFLLSGTSGWRRHADRQSWEVRGYRNSDRAGSEWGESSG